MSLSRISLPFAITTSLSMTLRSSLILSREMIALQHGQSLGADQGPGERERLGQPAEEAVDEFLDILRVFPQGEGVDAGSTFRRRKGLPELAASHQFRQILVCSAHDAHVDGI